MCKRLLSNSVSSGRLIHDSRKTLVIVEALIGHTLDDLHRALTCKMSNDTRGNSICSEESTVRI